MTINVQTLIAIISCAAAVLSWSLTKTYSVAEKLTKALGEIEQLRADHLKDVAEALAQRNNIGEKVRQTESKLWYLAWMTCPEEKRQEVLNAMVRRHN